MIQAHVNTTWGRYFCYKDCVANLFFIPPDALAGIWTHVRRVPPSRDLLKGATELLRCGNECTIITITWPPLLQSNECPLWEWMWPDQKTGSSIQLNPFSFSLSLFLSPFLFLSLPLSFPLSISSSLLSSFSFSQLENFSNYWAFTTFLVPSLNAFFEGCWWQRRLKLPTHH